jgi:HlyD family secretion protein
MLRVPIGVLGGRPDTHAATSRVAPGSKLPRFAATVGLVVVVAISGYVAYGKLTTPVATAVAAQTVQVQKGTITSSVSSTGTVSPLTQAKLSFSGSGAVTEVNVRVGDSVTKGQTLAKLDTTSLALQVSQAKAAVSSAEAKLATVKASSASVDVSAAQASVDAAKSKLAQMQSGGRAEEIASSQASLDNAKANLNQLLAGPTQADVTSAQQGVASAQAVLQAAQNTLATVKAGATADAIRNAELEVERAKNSLWSTQISRDGTCGNSKNQEYQCKAADASVAAAETAVTTAQNSLAALKVPAKAEDVAAAEKNVASAQAQLVSAQAKLSDVQAGSKPDAIVAAKASVTQAEQALILKQKPYTDSDIQAQKQAVAQAEAALVAKQQPYTDADVLSAQAALDQAKASLDLTQYNLMNAALVAPFDGVVSAVGVNPGENSASPAVTLVDTRALRLDVTVDESDIAKVQTGQKATITFDSISEQTFDGKVTGVAPSATITSGVATYTVSLSITNPGAVKSGMTGNASIVYGEQANVLVVPNRAIKTLNKNKVVEVMVNGVQETRQVTVGASNDTMTEITNGLSEGDQVVITGTSTSTSSRGVGNAVIGVPAGGPPPN